MPRTIRFTTAPCALGHLLVAAGERGIAHLRFGDDPSALETSFLAAFPEALRAPADDLVCAWARALVTRLEAWDGRGGPPELPLDIGCGTPFQRRVWEHLRVIPVGETRSYGAVAAAIGHPRAARAVARACARNPIAWLVPCHRVVPAGGGPGGYRWGAGRKRALLRRESALCGGSPPADVPVAARASRSRTG